MDICFTTYNMLDLTSVHDERFASIRQSVLEIQPDVLAIQELVAANQSKARGLLRDLADELGMVCAVDSRGTTALASSQNHYHVGLLWRPELCPVPGSWRPYEAPDFWHALGKITLDLGTAQPVTFASYHADPFRPQARFEEAHRVVAALTRPPGPTMIGGDFNSLSSDRGRNGDYYDPDLFASREWSADLLYQVQWEDDPTAPVRADRRAGEVLRRGGLQDAAASLSAPWEPTVGHWPGEDPLGERRIDIIRTTHHMRPALTGYSVLRTPAALRASDHLPVSVDFDPLLITQETAVPAAQPHLAGHTTNYVGPGTRIGGSLSQTGTIGSMSY